MIEIISVRFKSGGKQYYFNPNGVQFQEGDGVIVETSRGSEYAECSQANTMIDEIELMAPLRSVVRLATEEDKKIVAKNREKETKAFTICKQKIAEHELDMKLVDVEYSFEGNKILFFFTSEGRVDFRALVKDLASALHARIELRQIGVRDEAKMLGGLGICGRPLCCAQFLSDFQPVSIKMAKTQSLSLNPTKISGTCGRLMCCLKYEQDAYEDLLKRAPKAESFVETPDGVGTVASVNLLRETVQVRLDNTPETPRCYHNCEICVVRSGKGRRPEGYVEPSAQELAKLRKQPEEPQQRKPKQEDSLGAAIEAVFQRERQTPNEEERGNRNRRNTPKKPKHKGENPSVEEKTVERKSERKSDRPQANSPRPKKFREGGNKPQNAPKSTLPAEQSVPKGEGKRMPYRRRRKPGGKPQEGQN